MNTKQWEKNVRPVHYLIGLFVTFATTAGGVVWQTSKFHSEYQRMQDEIGTINKKLDELPQSDKRVSSLESEIANIRTQLSEVKSTQTTNAATISSRLENVSREVSEAKAQAAQANGKLDIIVRLLEQRNAR